MLSHCNCFTAVPPGYTPMGVLPTKNATAPSTTIGGYSTMSVPTAPTPPGVVPNTIPVTPVVTPPPSVLENVNPTVLSPVMSARSLGLSNTAQPTIARRTRPASATLPSTQPLITENSIYKTQSL